MPAQPALDRRAEFSIRRAVPTDVLAIRSVLYSVRQEYGVLWEIGANDPELDDLEGNYFRRGGHFEVIENAAEGIVGCAGLYPLTARRAELGKMYIQAAARGHGLGKQLLENMLAAARRGGFAEVLAETSSTLTAAITLYQRYGFQQVQLEEFYHHCDVAYLLRLA